jgi:ice-binding like protein/Big-like domain-containing protein
MYTHRRTSPRLVLGMLATVALIAAACGDNSPTQPPASAIPTMSSTGPASAATGVPRNVAVTATFSENMNSSTISTATFTLSSGGIAIPAVVTYLGKTATLNPVSTLASNTVFTATMSRGAKDLQGDSMAAAKVWSFTTVATSLSGPAAVNLGTAGSYVILAKSGVSTTGTTAVVGNVGLSPAAASFITGFALSAPATTFTTSARVTGQVFAANYAVPTPATLTVAVLDMQTAYTNAAGRTLPDFTELGAGNINGMTLAPGLYKWGTGLLIPAVVTLSGGVDDVWIFQIAQNLTVGNGAIVTLTGGAQAKNVFWQVAGSATLGTTSNFKGIILSKTLIALNTGAIMSGRALAQTAVTLNATAITNP